MRHLAVAALVCASGHLVLGSQLRREPLIVSAPYEVINPRESPIELAAGDLNLGGRAVETLTVRLRAKRVSTRLDDIVIRLAAGLFDSGMVTYRMRVSDSVSPLSLQPPSDDPGTWTMAIFERMREDPPPDFGQVGRKTRFVVTVEQVRDASGAIVYHNPDCREQLWKALGGSDQ